MTIETKYNIGDEVWVMYENKPTCLTIAAMDIGLHKKQLWVIYYMQPYEIDPLKMSNVEYIPYNRAFYEKDVFPTKEELLKSLYSNGSNEL